MTKMSFRVLVSIPAVVTIVAIALMLVREHSDWPAPALQYEAAVRLMPFTSAEKWITLLSIGSLLGAIASTVGLVLFWSPARYAYLLFVVCAVLVDIPLTPVLVGMPEAFLDNVAKFLFGLCLGLIFTEPCKSWFVVSTA
jgi:hypothetical protein